MGNFIKSLGKIVKTNGPAILACAGIVGMAASTVWAVKSTPKAMRNIEKRKEELDEANEPCTVKEVIKATWKCYLPSALIFATSSACILGSLKNLEKRNVALAALQTLSEQNLKEYIEKTRSVVGEKKEKTIHDEVMTDRVKSTGVMDNVIVSGNGKIPCVMTEENKLFESTANDIDRAINKLNARINGGEYISLNDLYYELGIDFTSIGDKVGWPANGNGIKRLFTSGLNDQDIPYLVFDFETGHGPVYGFDRM